MIADKAYAILEISNKGFASDCSLGLLVKKVDEPQVDLILNHLSGMITGGKQSQNREIASLGLKAVIADLPTGKGAQPLIKRCASVLIHGLQTQACSLVFLKRLHATLSQVNTFEVLLTLDSRKMVQDRPSDAVYSCLQLLSIDRLPQGYTIILY